MAQIRNVFKINLRWCGGRPNKQARWANFLIYQTAGLPNIIILRHPCCYYLVNLWPFRRLLQQKTMKFHSAAKQQTSWVVSLWQSPLTFVWPGVPKDCWLGLIGAPSDGDWNAIWWYFVSIRLYLAMLLYSWIALNQPVLLFVILRYSTWEKIHT